MNYQSTSNETVFTVDDVTVFYETYAAIRNVSLTVAKNEITAFIGPSGCGKSTLLRAFNRMNDLIPGSRLIGNLDYHGTNLYAPDIDPIEVRKRIGMVFQKPNVFPKSIYENVAYGPKVKGDLKKSAYALSGGQQQRLVITRCIAVRPEVILMDEPCASLDPIATAKIEDLMKELAVDYTIIIVTHNMQQAARVSDRTAFFTAEVDSEGERHGLLVEFGPTRQIFSAPQDPRTEDYIPGRFG